MPVSSQEEVLRKYCSLQNINVRHVIKEDYSAKTFNRPAWTDMLSSLRKEKGKFIDLLLFTKWDRFSRNAGDAYQMINILGKVGVDPQAVEQPLDLSIPENKMMLAFYLAAPEVENDRRALNTFYGMRRARKEGRYLTTGPYGYINRTTDTGKKTIVPMEPKAGIVRWAFNEVAKGIYQIDDIRKQVNDKGLNCSKSNFYTLLRNPVYCGKIVVPAYRDEVKQLVEGQHEAIVSEALFYEVQDVLDGKKRIQFVKSTTTDMLPLRGFLCCPRCNKQLTGSASKGRNGYYYYYHCASSCGTRFKADLANNSFIAELAKFTIEPEVIDLYKGIVNDMFHQKTDVFNDGRKELLNQIQNENDKLSKARRLLLEDALDTGDYKIIKTECEQKLLGLEAKLTGFAKPAFNFADCLNKALENLSRLETVYTNGDNTVKRLLIGSIYPEKLSFDGEHYRTTKINEFANLIYLINSKLKAKKIGQNLIFQACPIR